MVPFLIVFGSWHDLLVLCHLLSVPLLQLCSVCSLDRCRSWSWGFLFCGLEVVKPNQVIFFQCYVQSLRDRQGKKKQKKQKLWLLHTT